MDVQAVAELVNHKRIAKQRQRTRSRSRLSSDRSWSSPAPGGSAVCEKFQFSDHQDQCECLNTERNGDVEFFKFIDMYLAARGLRALGRPFLPYVNGFNPSSACTVGRGMYGRVFGIQTVDTGCIEADLAKEFRSALRFQQYCTTRTQQDKDSKRGSFNWVSSLIDSAQPGTHGIVDSVASWNFDATDSDCCRSLITFKDLKDPTSGTDDLSLYAKFGSGVYVPTIVHPAPSWPDAPISLLDARLVNAPRDGLVLDILNLCMPLYFRDEASASLTLASVSAVDAASLHSVHGVRTQRASVPMGGMNIRACLKRSSKDFSMVAPMEYVARWTPTIGEKELDVHTVEGVFVKQIDKHTEDADELLFLCFCDLRFARSVLCDVFETAHDMERCCLRHADLHLGNVVLTNSKGSKACIFYEDEKGPRVRDYVDLPRAVIADYGSAVACSGPVLWNAEYMGQPNRARYILNFTLFDRGPQVGWRRDVQFFLSQQLFHIARVLETRCMFSAMLAISNVRSDVADSLTSWLDSGMIAASRHLYAVLDSPDIARDSSWQNAAECTLYDTPLPSSPVYVEYKSTGGSVTSRVHAGLFLVSVVRYTLSVPLLKREIEDGGFLTGITESMLSGPCVQEIVAWYWSDFERLFANTSTLGSIVSSLTEDETDTRVNIQTTIAECRKCLSKHMGISVGALLVAMVQRAPSMSVGEFVDCNSDDESELNILCRDSLRPFLQKDCFEERQRAWKAPSWLKERCKEKLKHLKKLFGSQVLSVCPRPTIGSFLEQAKFHAEALRCLVTRSEGDQAGVLAADINNALSILHRQVRIAGRRCSLFGTRAGTYCEVGFDSTLGKKDTTKQTCLSFNLPSDLSKYLSENGALEWYESMMDIFGKVTLHGKAKSFRTGVGRSAGKIWTEKLGDQQAETYARLLVKCLRRSLSLGKGDHCYLYAKYPWSLDDSALIRNKWVCFDKEKLESISQGIKDTYKQREWTKEFGLCWRHLKDVRMDGFANPGAFEMLRQLCGGYRDLVPSERNCRFSTLCGGADKVDRLVAGKGSPSGMKIFVRMRAALMLLANRGTFDSNDTNPPPTVEIETGPGETGPGETGCVVTADGGEFDLVYCTRTWFLNSSGKWTKYSEIMTSPKTPTDAMRKFEPVSNYVFSVSGQTPVVPPNAGTPGGIRLYGVRHAGQDYNAWSLTIANAYDAVGRFEDGLIQSMRGFKDKEGKFCWMLHGDVDNLKNELKANLERDFQSRDVAAMRAAMVSGWNGFLKSMKIGLGHCLASMNCQCRFKKTLAFDARCANMFVHNLKEEPSGATLSVKAKVYLMYNGFEPGSLTTKDYKHHFEKAYSAFCEAALRSVSIIASDADFEDSPAPMPLVSSRKRPRKKDWDRFQSESKFARGHWKIHFVAVPLES